MRTRLPGILLGILLCTPATALALDYQVRRGDNLTRIAARFGTTVAAIQAANGLSTTTIYAGEILKIPGQDDPPPSGAAGVTVVVRSGDSLGRIASRNGVTLSSLRYANNIPGSVSLIHPGQKLVIPGGTTLPASTTRSTATTPPSTTRVTPPPATTRRVPTLHASQAELEILARIVKGEVWPSAPFEGKVAVAAVVLNRVRAGGFPNTIAGVAHEPSQFSCYNSNNRRRLYLGPIPTYAWEAARAALAGQDPSGGSTYYFNPFLVRPTWARRLHKVVRIGTRRYNTHDFYRRPGDAPTGFSGLSGRVSE